MELKYILGLRTEIGNLRLNYENLTVFLYENDMELKNSIESNEKIKNTSLLIAASDETIMLGKALNIAIMAYVNPSFPKQSYSGVEMLVEGFEEVDADFLEKVYQRFHHIPWTILETGRCVVRELSLDDLDDLFELYAGEEIDRFTDSLYPYEEEKEFQRAYIQHMYRYFGYGMWLAFEKETKKLIGRVGLEHREYNEVVELELGYLIGKNYQRKGYATELCTAILDYAQENTGFERINTLIEDGNEISIALSRKLGFEHAEDYELDGKVMHRFVKNFNSSVAKYCNLSENKI